MRKRIIRLRRIGAVRAVYFEVIITFKDRRHNGSGLEEKLGFVEFLCLYRGFKSEPKLTFHGTPWEHYQRFLPVLFTLLTLDNTTV